MVISKVREFDRRSRIAACGLHPGYAGAGEVFAIPARQEDHGLVEYNPGSGVTYPSAGRSVEKLIIDKPGRGD
jgi:hypothetical protein